MRPRCSLQTAGRWAQAGSKIAASISIWSRQCRFQFKALLSGGNGAVNSSTWPNRRAGEIPMSVQMVLLPVLLQIGLTFALLVMMVGARRQTLVSGQTKIRDVALGEPKWPKRATQIGNCYRNQFELPVLFYVLIALALPLRHADFFIVLASWVFVIARFIHAGIFVSSNDFGQRSTAWLVGAVVLLMMWIYFALNII